MDRSETESNERASREMEHFEGLLRGSMQRREAPLGLKQRVLARARERRRLEQRPWWQVHLVQRVAATAVLVAVIGGFVVQRQMAERALEQKKGEEAREQVMTAMRITSRTLGRVNERLTDSGR